MAKSSSDLTSLTLLGRVSQQPSDPAAWDEFVARYGPRIRAWCVGRGLQPADADDVTQEVLLRLTRALKGFNYDSTGTFRGWLRVVTQHALFDFFTARKNRAITTSGDDKVLAVLETVEARDELLTFLEQEYARELVGRACAVVRARVDANTWEAFRLSANEGRKGEEIAELLGMNVAAVFKAKSRVLGFIRQEIERLDRQP